MGIFSKLVVECDAGYEEAWLEDVINIVKEMKKNGQDAYSVSGLENGHWRRITIELNQ